MRMRRAMDLAEMQTRQPWKLEYSEEFLASIQDRGLHRSLAHDLHHIIKACGILSSIAEWADHGDTRKDRVSQKEFEARIADLVICAMHMASHTPFGYKEFNIYDAVVGRITDVNGPDWLK